MMKFGLKLWSTNERHVEEAVRLYDQGVYSFIELFAEPRTYGTHIHLWKDLPIPFVIHAPHYQRGLNLARKENYANNIVLMEETRNFADTLKADAIVVHPGVGGDIKETARQLNDLDEQRILVENKPYYALASELTCNGSSPNEIAYLLRNARVRFCLDIGHAICAANAYQKDPMEYLQQFLELKPLMYHLTDGDYHGVLDRHDHIGRGNFDTRKIISLLPRDSRITVETKKDSQDSLGDFEADVIQLKKLALDKFALRRATENDLMDVYYLSNDTVVRRNSFDQDHIPLEDHTHWFMNSIRDENTAFYVVTDPSDEFIGQVRFKQMTGEQGGYLVSISLVKYARGLGLGPRILEAASLRVSQEKNVRSIYALIKLENKFSLNIFLKAGYTLISEDSTSFKLRYCVRANNLI